jgi:peptidoglycan/LPS O-acetylase OafA/YrhL
VPPAASEPRDKEQSKWPVAAPRVEKATGKSGFRADIEGLRGVAVLLVVLFHAALLSNAPVQIQGGFIGVDLFFVLSGFLITGLLIHEREKTGRISFAGFYARRVRRILPAAAVVLLITIPLSYVLVTLIRRPDTMLDAATAALSIANVRFALTTDYFNPVNYSPFLHFWSLGVEEQFYLVWPVLLFVAAWRRPRLGAGAVLFAVLVLSLAASIWATDWNPTWAFYMLPTRAWQLAAGGLLAIGAGSSARAPSLVRRWLSPGMSCAGWIALAALGFEALTLDSSTVPYPGLAALVPTMAGVVLIASGPERLGPGLLLRLPPVRFLGKISYSLYLWHWPILILGGLILGGSLEMVDPSAPLQLLTPAQGLALALIAVPVAAASWFFIEEPFRRGRIALPRPSRVVMVGVSAMAVLAVVASGLNYAAQGDLNDLGGDVSGVTATGSPQPTATATPIATPTDSGPVSGAEIPTPTPVPTPWMTPALTPAPVQTPSTYAVTNALRPTLGKAPTDYEQPWHAGCLAFASTANIPRVGDCVYGNPGGTYTVALIGDSHASALFPAVNAVAIAHGWKLLVFLKINCAFVDIPLYDPNAKRTYTECATWNSQVITRMNASPPDLIIVTMSRWIQNERSSDGTVTNEGKSMGREMAKLPVASKLTMITDIPDPQGHDVPDCLSAHLKDYRSCDYSRSLGFAYNNGAREAIAATAAGASLISLADSICPGTGNCPVVMDGMIMFRDDHHLTATFAASLGPALDRQIVDILVASRLPSSPPTPT